MTPPTTGSFTTTHIASILATSVSNLSVAMTCMAIVVLFVLIAFAIATHEAHPRLKGPLYTLIATIVLLSTLVLGGASFALNFSSSTGGPVRWTADFQVWACGNQLNLRDPRGALTDRIGSPVLFEKNDGRIHYDGTPTNMPNDVTLGSFMRVVGGNITPDSLIFPINSENGFIGTPQAPEQIQPYIQSNSEGSYVRFLSGQTCGLQKATVQTFVYQFNEATNTYTQSKVANPTNYEISHQKSVPPGDCIIMEFAPPKNRTDHLCQSYGQRDTQRCSVFGVPADKTTTCDIQEVTP